MEAESLLEDPSSFQPDERDKHHYVPPTVYKGGQRKQIIKKGSAVATKVSKQPPQQHTAEEVSTSNDPNIVPQI